MNKRTLVNAFGVTAVVVALGVWAVQRADAIIIVNSKPAVDTGTFGISAFDIARVHIANIASGAVPCVVEVRFYAPDGTVIDAVGQKVMPGQSAFVDFSDATLRPPMRRHLRARVFQLPPPDDDQPTPACAVTTEVFDSRTGQALFIIDDGDRPR